MVFGIILENLLILFDLLNLLDMSAVDHDTAWKAVRQMLKDFETMDEEKRLGMLIMTIHQDIGFEVLFPDEWKNHPMIYEYYESKKEKVFRSPELKKFCREKANPLFQEWSKLFRSYVN